MNQQLFQYLSDEYAECMTEEEALVRRRDELEEKKRKFEESISLHLEDEKRRQLFSPLYLQDVSYQNDGPYEEFQLTEEGQELAGCLEELGKLAKKKKKLEEFIHSLNQVSMSFEDKEEDETILFFPAFHEVVRLTKKVISEIEIDYDEDKISTGCRMTLGFLWDWKKLFHYLSDSLLLSYIMINTLADKDKIMIVIECISKVPLGNQAKNGLEKVLSKDAFLQSWGETTFEIHMVIK